MCLFKKYVCLCFLQTIMLLQINIILKLDIMLIFRLHFLFFFKWPQVIQGCFHLFGGPLQNVVLGALFCETMVLGWGSSVLLCQQLSIPSFRTSPHLSLFLLLASTTNFQDKVDRILFGTTACDSKHLVSLVMSHHN